MPLCIDLTWGGEEVYATGEMTFCFCSGRGIEFNPRPDRSQVAAHEGCLLTWVHGQRRHCGEGAVAMTLSPSYAWPCRSGGGHE